MIDEKKLIRELQLLADAEGKGCDEAARMNLGDEAVKYSHGEYCYVKAIEAVKKQSKTDGWILCSERMPEAEDLREKSLSDCKSYIVQRRSGAMGAAHYIKVYGESYFESNAFKISDVIAWQPFPETFQAEGQGGGR